MAAISNNFKILDQTICILRSKDENKQSKALAVFSRVTQEVKDQVYGNLSREYWRSGEYAFYSQNGLSSTPEQKAQAIEMSTPYLREFHSLLGSAAADLLQFNSLPAEVRGRVYGELYQMLPFEKDYWGCAEDAFHDRNGLSSTLEQKRLAIHCCLLRSIGSLSDVKLMLEFMRAIPEEHRRAIYSELDEIIRFAGVKDLSGEAAFFSEDERVLLSDRAQAIGNYLLIFQGGMKQRLHDEILAAKEAKHLDEMIHLIQGQEEMERMLDQEEPIDAQGEVLVVENESHLEEEMVIERKAIEDLRQPFGSRSILSNTFMGGLSNYQAEGLLIDGQLFFPITGATQGFSKQRLVSCGSSPTRELLYLDPQRSPLLSKHYETFRATLFESMSTMEILTLVKEYVGKKIFHDKAENLKQRVEEFVAKASLTYPAATHSQHPGKQIPMVSIDEFIRSGIGLCRHQALAACYILDRLQEDSLLEGTVQHMRSILLLGTPPTPGAHTWVVFTPKRKATPPEPSSGWLQGVAGYFRRPSPDSMMPPERWHLDSFWNVLSNLADLRQRFELKRLYGPAVINEELNRTLFAAGINGQPQE